MENKSHIFFSFFLLLSDIVSTELGYPIRAFQEHEWYERVFESARERASGLAILRINIFNCYTSTAYNKLLFKQMLIASPDTRTTQPTKNRSIITLCKQLYMGQARDGTKA